MHATLFALLLFAFSTTCQGGQKCRLVANLEDGKKQVVVAYGTSLTANGAWVTQIADVLNKRYPGLATVINSGGSGQWSEWGVTNLNERVLRKHPDTVFIEFSINDSVERFKGSVEIARTNLDTMIESVLKANPQCDIILMTMTPGNQYPQGHRSYRKDIEAHYEMYRAVANARGLMLIEHYPRWMALQASDKELFQKYVPDTIHPTAEGCARIVTPAILAALGIESAELRAAAVRTEKLAAAAQISEPAKVPNPKSESRAASATKDFRMMVEYADKPLVIGTRKPRFSWEVPLTGRNRKQSAYQILVATSAKLLKPGSADLWDSGKVESAQSVNVEYAGTALRSNLDCFWCVRVWDEAGAAGEFGPAGYFGTGLVEESDWKAQWIGMGRTDEPFSDPTEFQQKRVAPAVAAVEPDPRAPLLRREFALEKPVKRARAFVCGLGLFELRLNGAKVGDDVLATPRTDFRKRVLYSAYDVTGLLRTGGNAVGLILGNGWFNGQKSYWGWQYQWYGSPRAIVQIEIEFTDGSRQRVVSDGTWQGSWSPITFNCIFDGEHYDARLEQPGWDAPGFDTAGWQKVNAVAAPGGKLDPVTHEQNRVVQTIRPVSVREPEPGVFVFDMGVNMTGWVRLELSGGKAGETVVLHYGEAQREDGALNASSNNKARQTDRYTLRGGEKEVYEPRFTYHGFQFVEVRGYPGKPDLGAVTGCFVRAAVPQTGNFECSQELINQIHRCTLQSQLCNVQMGVPTDDTQRPERLGWGCDVWATAQEALYNLWMPRVYQKWVGDFRDQQEQTGMVGMIAPQAGSEEDLVWSAAFVLVPWWQYIHCGDRRILEENYPALERYMEFLRRTGCRKVVSVPPKDVTGKLLWWCGAENRFPPEAERGHLQISQWGDHLSTAEGFIGRSNLPLSIAAAFYYLDASVMEKIATALGHSDDAVRYRKLAAEIKAAFNERFLDSGLGYYDTGVQSAQAWPLAFGLVPEEQRRAVDSYFSRSVGQVQRHLTTGYAGTKFAIEALSNNGHDDIVWKLATATDYPSWGFMLRRNRTTTCEQWNGESGSLNHAALGAAIDEWFYWGLAGIRPDAAAPGFERIIFKPYMPADLTWAKASIATPRGTVASEWRHEGETTTLRVSVPANCSAVVHLPAADAAAITEGGVPAASAEGVKPLPAIDRTSVFEIGSGTYQFEFRK